MNAEMENDTNYAAARAEYLDRATVDPEWREVLQRSADLVLANLEPAERARLLDYLGKFSACSAAFIVKELAEVHALKLYSGGGGGGQTIKRPTRGGNRRGAETSAGRRSGPLSARAEQLRGDHEIARGRSATGRSAVCGMAGVRRGVHDRVWMWLSDDHKREQLAGAQFRQWRATGDERVWWRFFDVDPANPANVREVAEGAD